MKNLQIGFLERVAYASIAGYTRHGLGILCLCPLPNLTVNPRRIGVWWSIAWNWDIL